MVYKSTRISENTARLQDLLSKFDHLPFDHTAAESFGQIKTHLRRIDRPIPDIDLQIASISLANDITVLTADAHFKNIPNLKRENGL
ncbi:MAG TPA: type II toxin-antitoxin system VapC family toxin [Tepidisphaeraceae bacterium]|jgi:predicted nucleic acid-binding protein|nr:type II toxin-antitoxin system VapC family toxin [Tepidisphaeraceae bacterium]